VAGLSLEQHSYEAYSAGAVSTAAYQNGACRRRETLFAGRASRPVGNCSLTGIAYDWIPYDAAKANRRSCDGASACARCDESFGQAQSGALCDVNGWEQDCPKLAPCVRYGERPSAVDRMAEAEHLQTPAQRRDERARL
jgi:hypothetical protein